MDTRRSATMSRHGRYASGARSPVGTRVSLDRSRESYSRPVPTRKSGTRSPPRAATRAVRRPWQSGNPDSRRRLSQSRRRLVLHSRPRQHDRRQPGERRVHDWIGGIECPGGPFGHLNEPADHRQPVGLVRVEEFLARLPAEDHREFPRQVDHVHSTAGQRTKQPPSCENSRRQHTRANGDQRQNVATVWPRFGPRHGLHTR